MSLRNSSTSSSEARLPELDEIRRPMRDVLTVSAWVLGFLVGFEVTVNSLFPHPTDPRQPPSGQLVVYFDYGRSIEGKIRRLVGPTDETSGPLASAGWIDGDDIAKQPDRASRSDGMLISVYGMSFSSQVGTAMAELDPRITPRLFGGPAAPPNHSYATYQRDRGGNARVVILGVLASSVVGLATNNGMTWRFEGPAPFTYPRFRSTPAGLEARWPSVRTLGQMREALGDPDSWHHLIAQIRADDDVYDPFLFTQNVLDRSALVRLVRRAWGQRVLGQVRGRLRTSSGFVQDSDEIKSLRAILAAFSDEVRKDGKLPLVLLIHDPDYRDHLYQAVKSTLEEKQIPFVSTHTICPTTNPRNFLPDSHFTPEANRLIAWAVLEKLDRHVPRGKAESRMP
jgi:hypothetical protein